MTKPLHMTLAPKGGIGKSLIAALIAQWLADTGQNPIAFDNDPATATLMAYKGFSPPVRQLDLLRDGLVNQHAYDEMFMAMANEGGSFVVDNGASNFLEILNYIELSGLMEVMLDIGVQPYIHVPIVGGDDMALTMAGFEQIVARVSTSAKIVVWLNRHKADMVIEGVPWEKTALYQRYKGRIEAELQLDRRDKMAVDAIANMLTDRLTFKEVAESEDAKRYNLIDKSRLRRFREDVFDQLTQVFGAPAGEIEAA